jgi:hypothetical protein
MSIPDDDVDFIDRYADDHGIDVTRTLRGELELRGYPAGELEWVDQAAAAVRKLP